MNILGPVILLLVYSFPSNLFKCVALWVDKSYVVPLVCSLYYWRCVCVCVCKSTVAGRHMHKFLFDFLRVWTWGKKREEEDSWKGKKQDS